MFIPKQHSDFYRKNAFFIIFAVAILLFYSLNSTLDIKKKLYQHVNISLFWDEKHKIASFDLPIIIHVYDNYCMYCKRDHMLFAEFEGRSKIRIAGLNVSKNFDDMLTFIGANENMYDVNLYPSSAKAVAQLGIDSLPTTVVLDKRGDILAYFKGSLSEHVFKNEIVASYKKATSQ